MANHHTITQKEGVCKQTLLDYVDISTFGGSTGDMHYYLQQVIDVYPCTCCSCVAGSLTQLQVCERFVPVASGRDDVLGLQRADSPISIAAQEDGVGERAAAVGAGAIHIVYIIQVDNTADIIIFKQSRSIAVVIVGICIIVDINNVSS